MRLYIYMPPSRLDRPATVTRRGVKFQARDLPCKQTVHVLSLGIFMYKQVSVYILYAHIDYYKYLQVSVTWSLKCRRPEAIDGISGENVLPYTQCYQIMYTSRWVILKIWFFKIYRMSKLSLLNNLIIFKYYKFYGIVKVIPNICSFISFMD